MGLSIDEVRALPAAVQMKQVSEALGLSLDSTYAGANSGELPVVRVGRRMFMPKAVLLRMLQMDETTAAGQAADPTQ
jgi:hypothetical protein